jgi:predicted ABC-type transport system involved in lysophospholipase L1 biosynthesis ATPase subunit
MSTDSPAPLIRAVDLAKTYGRPPTAIRVLSGVSLAIRAGERVAILGKSGSGKSTLLNLIGGLDAPTAGSIEVAGRDLATMTPNERAHYRLGTVGMIFQAFHLVASRTALENVELPMYFAGRRGVERRRAARQALEGVGLGDRLTHRPSELSGGERQRVAIARALVNRPAILIADEPTGNLDSVTGNEVVELLIKHLEATAATLLLVTHDEELAERVTHRILRIHDGKLTE